MATNTLNRIGFHASRDYATLTAVDLVAYKHESEFTYSFENFFHPFLGELVEKLNKESLPGIFDPTFQAGLAEDFFTKFYKPRTSKLVRVEYSPKEIDVSVGGSYSNYNWELFFHIPVTIAVHLSKNQRFAEAMRWFHFVFDPTANDTSVEVPQRYWKFLAFREGGAGTQIDELLELLSKPVNESTSEELDLKTRILAGYEAIKNNPFQPHAVARTRHVAYMYFVVMKYLDNLIAWGDHLFRQDTLESINEATQVYVLAANVLGDRPEKIPLKGTVRPKTFAELQEQGLDAMGNALVELEGEFPFNFGIPSENGESDAAAPLFGVGRTLYFCVPRNEKLLGYWDTVADRLFKIRNCLNIEGVLRPLALFEPPLDPGMLVKAAAAGIDVGAVVAGLNQPVSPVRAQLLIQKALECCAEVRGLGSSLLQAIEKEDGERLGLLRQGHEIRIQQLQQDVRFLQWKQAQEATEGLLKTRDSALERYKYYLRLLGQTPDGDLAPDTLALDRRELTEESFDEAYEALVGAYDKEVPLRAHADLGVESDSGKLYLTRNESGELDHLTSARNLGLAASIVNATRSALVFLPDPKINLQYWGLGTTVDLKVGTAIQTVVGIAAEILQMTAAWDRDQAGIASRTASYERRADDWILQANLAARELRQIGRQVISSLIAEQIAHREYRNIQQQIEDSQEVDRFLREKFSNAELYGWMQGELSGLYYKYYRFAFDLARQAEQTMKWELMRPELDSQNLVKFNYWDAGRRGLLSGEALYLDVKRMEMAYHEHNLREFELTKHVSLLQVDPLALIDLRAKGCCTVSLPESLFDLDGPGHYFRRIKSVAVSIPCTTGPYAGVHCKLTLDSSSVRKSSSSDGGYPRTGKEDPRFQDYAGSAQSVVVSSAQEDSGLFETDLRDERFLPFENAGVISVWELELPANPNADPFEPAQFDYDTIADVVLHVRYTAREDEKLRDKALEHLRQLINSAEAAGSVRLFSLRHDFPTEWAKFTSQTTGSEIELAFTPRPEHYPFWSQGRLTNTVRVDLFAENADPSRTGDITVSDGAGNTIAVLTKDDPTGLFRGVLTELPTSPTSDFELHFDDSKLSELLVAVTWSG